MSVTLKKDSWKIKGGNGTYRDSAIFSTTLPEDAAAIVAEATSAIDAQQIRATDIVDTATNEIDTIVVRVNDLVDTGTDTTLTQSGAAADAKAAGDKIDAVYRGFSKIVSGSLMNFEYGYIDIPAVGSVCTITPTPYANRACGVSQITEGDSVCINVIGAGTNVGGGRAWAFLNSNYEVIDRAASSAVCEDLVKIAPDNAAYVVVNNKTDSQTNYYAIIGEYDVKGDIKKISDRLDDRTVYATTDIGDATIDISSGAVNSLGRFSSSAQACKTGTGVNTSYWYAGSTFTANNGYLFSYAFWEVPVTQDVATNYRIDFKRDLPAGKVITVPKDCYVLVSARKADDSDLPDDVDYKDFLTDALDINIYYKTVKDEIDKTAELPEYIANNNAASDTILNALVWGDNVIRIDNVTVGRLFDNGNVDTTVTTYKVSDYCLIKPNTTYTSRTSTTRVCFYDYRKEFISIIVGPGTTPFTTPSNACYIRMSTNVVPDYWAIVEGETVPGVTPYVPIKISRSVLQSEVTSEYNHGPYDIHSYDFVNWYSGLQEDYTTEGFTRTSTYAEVIEAFDNLAELDSDYITKNVLGTASGTDSGGNEYTIYEYVFRPKSYTSLINTRKMPKIYMDGSIHGFEKCSTYGLYYFLKDLILNWDKNPALEAIRKGVELHVIAVSNPYGFDRNSYTNGNSININRNFDHPGEWHQNTDPEDTSEWNGAAAFDQPESAIIRDWILADETNILAYLNLHTNGQWNASSYNEMNACMTSNDRNDEYYNRIFRVFTNHIESQTIRWPNMYSEIQPSDAQFCGKIQASATANGTKGTASAWGNTMRRIVSMTLEGFNGLYNGGESVVTVFSPTAYKINSENIGNMVIQVIKEFAE